MDEAPRPWKRWAPGPVPRHYVGDPQLMAIGQRGFLAGVTCTWQNGWYAVMVRPLETAWGQVTHAMITNRPNTPVRSWPDLMRIKDELFGPECVAIEVYPARADVVDGANMTHLWVLPEGFALPFGLHRADDSTTTNQQRIGNAAENDEGARSGAPSEVTVSHSLTHEHR